MKKIFLLFGSIVVCCGLYAAIALAKLQTTSEEVNQPDHAKVIEPDKLKEDLDFLFKTIEEVHPNMYAYISKEEFDPLCEQLYKNINRSMTRLEFYKLTAPIVAALKNSHTLFKPPYLDEFKRYYEDDGLVFPLEIRWDGSNAIVCRNYSCNSLPLNGQLLTINGRPAHELFANFSSLFAAECKHPYRDKYTNNPNLLRFLLFLEFGENETWELKLRSNDGKINNHAVKSVGATKIKSQKTKDNGFTSEFSCCYFPDHNTTLMEIKAFGGRYV